MAAEQGFDLVEVSPNVDPPVCRMMDYGKHKYQLSKKTTEKNAPYGADQGNQAAALYRRA